MANINIANSVDFVAGTTSDDTDGCRLDPQGRALR